MALTQSAPEGSITLATRRKGPAVWEFRWRETDAKGERVHRKRIIGNQEEYPMLSDAKRAAEPYRAQINAPVAPKMLTMKELWDHFQKNELHDPEVDRSPTTIEMYYTNMKAHILPEFGALTLDQVDAVTVEKWLRKLKRKPSQLSPANSIRGETHTLPLAPGTKCKLRNQLSCLFSHARRHKLFIGENPMVEVRQGGARVSIPDLLSLKEMQAIVLKLTNPTYRTLVLVAAVTALRRSEIRGLQWQDVDFDKKWLFLNRGIVRNHRTKLKTEASRKGLPIPPDLAHTLLELRAQSLYRAPEDWIFASPSVGGRSPLWMDNILNRYVRPAARAAGITKKRIGWHTFRRSLASLLAERGEPVHVVKELLRHAQASTTQDIYQQADQAAKRSAQSHTSELFLCL